MKKTGLVFHRDAICMGLAIVSLLIAGRASAQSKVSLESYLSSVRAKDPAFQSSQKMKEGAAKVQGSAGLMTGLNLVSSYSQLSDGRPTVNQSAQGDKTENNTWSVGLQQLTPFGFQWNLSQYYSHTTIRNSTIIAMPDYYDSYPQLQVGVNLWRNLLGAETRANRLAAESQLNAQKINADIGFIQRESEIKMAFYNLATQQENYEIQKDSLARTEKILSWSESRVKRNLSDRSDLYQTQALTSARRIDLMNAENKLKQAARTYNSFLGIDSDQVSDQLVVDEIDVNKLSLQKQATKKRLDLLAQQEAIKAQERGYLAQKEKNKPSLDLNLIYSKYGRDTTASEAQAKVYKDNRDYYLLAVNFSMPIDQWTASDARGGYEDLADSQALAEEVRQRNEKLEWISTVDQATTLAQQLKIVRELESVQKAKADLERSKYNNGRSTTYQVLTFEQDYVNSRNQRINLELQLRQFINSLDLYK